MDSNSIHDGIEDRPCLGINFLSSAVNRHPLLGTTRQEWHGWRTPLSAKLVLEGPYQRVHDGFENLEELRSGMEVKLAHGLEYCLREPPHSLGPSGGRMGVSSLHDTCDVFRRMVAGQHCVSYAIAVWRM